MLKVKSIQEPGAPADGLRILATRYRGRGLSAERYDVWMACLGPSEALLKSPHDAKNWRAWAARYRAEMLGEGAREPGNPLIRNAGQKFTLRLLRHLAERQDVTLLCHCGPEVRQCHRFLLRDLLGSARL